MKKVLCLTTLLLCLACLPSCALYGTATDERLMGTMSTDKTIATLIKKNLMDIKVAEGWNIDVYCYYGHVFLVGEAPTKMRELAIKTAKRDKRVRSVTAHWFTFARYHTSDFALATKLRTALIGTAGLNSTRIDTEVNAGRVVLLGVAASQAERKLAVKTARETSDVQTVTSYIILPPRPGSTNIGPTGTTYPGLAKSKPAAKTQPTPQTPAPQAHDTQTPPPDISPKPDTDHSGGDIVGHDI